jgi:hypothetical protein
MWNCRIRQRLTQSVKYTFLLKHERYLEEAVPLITGSAFFINSTRTDFSPRINTLKTLLTRHYFMKTNWAKQEHDTSIFDTIPNRKRN